MNNLVPAEFYLGQNYPNPFKEKTTIKYCVAYKTKVKITVYNSEGEMIKKLVDEEKNIGTYKTEFSTKGTVPAGRQGFAAGENPATGIWNPERTTIN